MPTAPFGLGYGLGVMANAIPTQMNQRQNEALMTQMRGLQLQQMQRQEAQQEALQQAGQAVQPEMETVQTAPTPQLGMSAVSPETQTAMKGLNLPVAGAVPNAPTPEQMAAVQKPNQLVTRQKVYTTPYQAAAYRYGAMADYLFKQGQVEPAMRLQQQAQQAAQMHQTTTLSQAARMASIGNYGDATKMLNGLGMNITGMDQSPDDPDTVQIHSSQNGQPVVADIPKQFLGAMIEDPAKAAQSIGMLNWRMATIGSRETIAGQRIASTEKQKELDRQNRLQVANVRASIPAGLRGSTTTADERKVQALMRDTGMTAPEAWDRVRPDVASRGQITDKDRLHALTARNAEIRKNLGSAPTKDDPEYQEYVDNQGTISSLMRGGKKPASPGVDVAGERAMADAAIKANPNAADRIKAAFKTRTGQDY